MVSCSLLWDRDQQHTSHSTYHIIIYFYLFLCVFFCVFFCVLLCYLMTSICPVLKKIELNKFCKSVEMNCLIVLYKQDERADEQF